jgi:hypothetical protein
MSLTAIRSAHRSARRAAAAALALFAAALPPLAQAGVDVGVSVQISQPGVYGRVDIGRFPQPRVIVAQPVVVRHVVMQAEPVYLWVPPGHRKKWGKHCARYDACGVPVYFVDDGWYGQHVHPRGKHKHRRDD